MGLRGPKPRRREVVWSREFAYAVGLMVADGNLSPDGRHLTFVSKDAEQIANIKECLAITARESVYEIRRETKTYQYFRLQWGDVTLYNFLVSIGLMPNKSLRLASIAVPDEYFFDFLRGTFDGDGSFYSYFDPRWKNSFMFYVNFVSGSKAHILWLRSTITRLLRVHGHVTSPSTQNLFHLRFAKREGLVLLQTMYAAGSKPFLSRKKLKIINALRIVDLSLSKT